MPGQGQWGSTAVSMLGQGAVGLYCRQHARSGGGGGGAVGLYCRQHARSGGSGLYCRQHARSGGSGALLQAARQVCTVLL